MSLAARLHDETFPSTVAREAWESAARDESKSGEDGESSDRAPDSRTRLENIAKYIERTFASRHPNSRTGAIETNSLNDSFGVSCSSVKF